MARYREKACGDDLVALSGNSLSKLTYGTLTRGHKQCFLDGCFLCLPGP